MLVYSKNIHQPFQNHILKANILFIIGTNEIHLLFIFRCLPRSAFIGIMRKIRLFVPFQLAIKLIFQKRVAATRVAPTWHTAACSMASKPPSGVSMFPEMPCWRMMRVNSVVLSVMESTCMKPCVGRHCILKSLRREGRRSGLARSISGPDIYFI